MAKAKTKTSNDNLVLFRVAMKDMKTVREILKREHIVGIRSVNQFARKVLVDYLEGRLEYKQPKFRRISDNYLPSEVETR